MKPEVMKIKGEPPSASETLEALVDKITGMLGTKGIEAAGRGARKAVLAADDVKTAIKIKLSIALVEGKYEIACSASVSQTETDTLGTIEETFDPLQGLLPFKRGSAADVAEHNARIDAAVDRATGGESGEVGEQTGSDGTDGSDTAGGATVPSDVAPELFERAVMVLKETHRASVSGLQRRLKIGYTLAARIMDIMEERGMVSPPKPGNTGARDILDLEVAV